MSNYNHSNARQYVENMDGMIWDEPFANHIDDVIYTHGISQEGFDELVREYAHRVQTMFNPNSYPWWVRICIAAKFLNPFS